jgi:benzodiazapine receptor
VFTHAQRSCTGDLTVKGMKLGSIASKGQLRMSFVRWAAFVVPLVLLLGFLSGRSVAAGNENAWYVALAKPSFTPPGWVFPVAWTILYVLIGFALAIALSARGAALRTAGVVLFAVQFALNLAWTPLFFGAHKVGAALFVIMLILALSIATAWVFSRFRPAAAALMLPYIAWLAFAGVLNWQIVRMNPNAETIVPASGTSQMIG